jgi:hypothetical protein
VPGAVLSSSEKRTEDLWDRLILDIKAVVLLQGSEADLKSNLQRRLIAPQDESLMKFTDALQTGNRAGTTRLFVIALGEMLFASLLVFAGTIALIPTLVGINTIPGLVQYFAQRVYSVVGYGPLAGYVSFIEFAAGVLLMLSALYTLRQAALTLKEIGFMVESGEE